MWLARRKDEERMRSRGNLSSAVPDRCVTVRYERKFEERMIVQLTLRVRPVEERAERYDFGFHRFSGAAPARLAFSTIDRVLKASPLA